MARSAGVSLAGWSAFEGKRISAMAARGALYGAHQAIETVGRFKKGRTIPDARDQGNDPAEKCGPWIVR